MKTDTRDRIYNYILKNAPITINELKEYFNISSQIIHRHVLRLFNEDKIYKLGKSPKVYYFPTSSEVVTSFEVNNNKKLIVDDNFVYFGADGNVKYGLEGFKLWCDKRSFDANTEIDKYIETLNKYSAYKNKLGLISGKQKLEDSFSKVYLDKVFYLDFYSIEKYGKTLLGNLLLYAKQTGDKELIGNIIAIINKNIKNLIEKYDIDAVAFIPPSIDRKTQLMSEINKGLAIKLPELKLIKIFKDKPVPQKSLKSKSDRIINARETIYIGDRNFRAKKILLIDDAVGSGSTLNETAKKIKEMKIAKKVIGLAIVGSYKGFDVINEV